TQGVWDRTLKVRQGKQEQPVQPFGQRVFLTVEDSHADPIVAATVKVHGLTGKNRIMQTGEANADDEAIRVLTVAFGLAGAGTVSADLYVPGFTSVSSIDLLEVSYSDGRSWKLGPSSMCRVIPDPMMLIANH